MARKLHGANILHLDIETAPNLAWTWSLFPKYLSPDFIVHPSRILCWAAMWEGDRTVMFQSTRPATGQKIAPEEVMIREMWDLLDEADMVVHYNGTAFDMKHLNREFLRYNLGPPSHYHQIDLLKTVRKQFKFPSNKLNYVSQALGLGKKTPHTGFQLWLDCMDNKAVAWQTMERYNKKDVKLLRSLYHKLLPWIHNHPNLGMWVTEPASPVCPTCASTNVRKKGTQHNTKTCSYTRYKCNSCKTPFRGRLRDKQTNPNVTVRTP